jgi:hypothetical protein
MLASRLLFTSFAPTGLPQYSVKKGNAEWRRAATIYSRQLAQGSI